MPNGLDGLAASFSDFAGGVTNDVSKFATRTESNVTAYYQEWVAASGIVAKLVNLLFNGVLSGFQSLNDFMIRLVGAICGPGVEADFVGLEQFMQNLQNSIGKVVEAVAGVVGEMENVVFQNTLIPIQNLVDGTSQSLQMQVESGFDDADCVAANNEWSWDDTVGHTSVGCARTYGDGFFRGLRGSVFPVADNQTVAVTAWVCWQGLAASSPPVQLDLIVTNSDGSTYVVGVGGVSSSLTSVGWTQMSGSWQVPSGAVSAQVRLGVRADALAGTFWFDDVSVVRQGLLKMSWVAQLEDSLAGLLSLSTWQDFLNRVYWSIIGAVDGPVGSVELVLGALVQRLSGLTVEGLIEAASLTNMAQIPNLLASSVVRAFGDAPVTLEENLESILHNFNVLVSAFGGSMVAQDLAGVASGLGGATDFFVAQVHNAVSGLQSLEQVTAADLAAAVQNFGLAIGTLQNMVNGLQQQVNNAVGNVENWVVQTFHNATGIWI